MTTMFSVHVMLLVIRAAKMPGRFPFQLGTKGAEEFNNRKWRRAASGNLIKL